MAIFGLNPFKTNGTKAQKTAAVKKAVKAKQKAKKKSGGCEFC
jgi:hypothetical protein